MGIDMLFNNITLIVKSNSILTPKENNCEWYLWTIHIESKPMSILDNIDHVTYHLHSTFPNPNITINKSDKNKTFQLKGRGWAEFIVVVDIFIKDSKYEIEHYLKLDYGNHQTEKRFRMST